MKTVLVTGSSTGIGEACAKRLAGRGWRVLAGVRKAGDEYIAKLREEDSNDQG